MPEFNLIKNINLITVNFGGKKKIDAASGRGSKGIVIDSSSLEAKTLSPLKKTVIKKQKS